MATTYCHWDPVTGNLLSESNEAGDTIATYTHEPTQYGKLLSQCRDGVTSHYHYDGMGNTRQLTNESGNVTDSYTYTAFGEAVEKTGSTTNPFGYKGAVGYYLNPETDDLYARARTYQPRMGRWLSVEPSGLMDGPNSFAYSGNAPIGWEDPSGLTKRRTKLNFLPTDGNLDDPTIGIIVKTVELTRNNCGGYKWKIKWRLRDSARRRGKSFILQHIHSQMLIHDCNRKKTAEELIQPFPGVRLFDDYWEAWRIEPMKPESYDQQSTDTYVDPDFGDCTCGQIFIVGTYWLLSGEIPNELNDRTPDVGLPATRQPLQRLVTGRKGRRHDLSARWNCCDARANCPAPDRRVMRGDDVPPWLEWTPMGSAEPTSATSPSTPDAYNAVVEMLGYDPRYQPWGFGHK